MNAQNDLQLFRSLVRFFYGRTDRERWVHIAGVVLGFVAVPTLMTFGEALPSADYLFFLNSFLVMLLLGLANRVRYILLILTLSWASPYVPSFLGDEGDLFIPLFWTYWSIVGLYLSLMLIHYKDVKPDEEKISLIQSARAAMNKIQRVHREEGQSKTSDSYQISLPGQMLLLLIAFLLLYFVFIY